MMTNKQSFPLNSIAVFDSGIGGLSVLSEIHQLLPDEPTIYLADQANVPYGSRPLEEVRRFAIAITEFFLANQAKMVVVACNTASAAALHELRLRFPTTLFVGMEPAIKPAAEQTRSGVVGVLATPATFQGELYASVIERFAQGVKVLQDTCPGLVSQIEAGQLETPQTKQIIEKALNPMLASGIDTVVLGCTHYPFVIPLIQEVVGQGVRVIDPAPAVAKQVARMLDHYHLRSPSHSSSPTHYYLTSGNLPAFRNMLMRLGFEAEHTSKVFWRGNSLTPVPPIDL